MPQHALPARHAGDTCPGPPAETLLGPHEDGMQTEPAAGQAVPEAPPANAGIRANPAHSLGGAAHAQPVGGAAPAASLLGMPSRAAGGGASTNPSANPITPTRPGGDALGWPLARLEAESAAVCRCGPR